MVIMLQKLLRKFSENWLELVKADIKKNPVLVYSKSYCPYCENTKKTLENLKVTSKVYELDQMTDGAKIQTALQELTKQKTFPNIFISGNHIGGNSDLMDGLKKGKIQKIFEDNNISYKTIT